MTDFQKAFEEIDCDSNGEITKHELYEHMTKNNFKKGFVETWLNLFDIDDNGVITYEEFCITLGLEPRQELIEKIKIKKESMALGRTSGGEGEITLKCEDKIGEDSAVNISAGSASDATSTTVVIDEKRSIEVTELHHEELSHEKNVTEIISSETTISKEVALSDAKLDTSVSENPIGDSSSGIDVMEVSAGDHTTANEEITFASFPASVEVTETRETSQIVDKSFTPAAATIEDEDDSSHVKGNFDVSGSSSLEFNVSQTTNINADNSTSIKEEITSGLMESSKEGEMRSSNVDVLDATVGVTSKESETFTSKDETVEITSGDNKEEITSGVMESSKEGEMRSSNVDVLDVTVGVTSSKENETFTSKDETVEITSGDTKDNKEEITSGLMESSKEGEMRSSEVDVLDVTVGVTSKESETSTSKEKTVEINSGVMESKTTTTTIEKRTSTGISTSYDESGLSSHEADVTEFTTNVETKARYVFGSEKSEDFQEHISAENVALSSTKSANRGGMKCFVSIFLIILVCLCAILLKYLLSETD